MMPAYWVVISVTAALVAVLVTILAIVFKFGSWYGEVNSDRKVSKEFMQKVDERMEKFETHGKI